MEVGGGRGRLYTYRCTVTTRMTHALRWAAMRAILMFHNCEGQSQDSVHRPQLLKRKESRRGFEPKSLCLPAVTARPNWLTRLGHGPIFRYKSMIPDVPTLRHVKPPSLPPSIALCLISPPTSETRPLSDPQQPLQQPAAMDGHRHKVTRHRAAGHYILSS